MSSYLHRSVANNAIAMVRPSIEMTMKSGIAKRFAGHLRISALKDGEWRLVAYHDFGDRETWEHPYEEIAIAKETISKRTGKTSREVQTMHPELLVQGDTVYYGNAMTETIIVSFSGDEPYFDEMFSVWTLAAYLALVQHGLERQRERGLDFYA
jgi:hypothetical protein